MMFGNRYYHRHCAWWLAVSLGVVACSGRQNKGTVGPAAIYVCESRDDRCGINSGLPYANLIAQDQGIEVISDKDTDVLFDFFGKGFERDVVPGEARSCGSALSQSDKPAKFTVNSPTSVTRSWTSSVKFTTDNELTADIVKVVQQIQGQNSVASSTAAGNSGGSGGSGGSSGVGGSGGSAGSPGSAPGVSASGVQAVVRAALKKASSEDIAGSESYTAQTFRLREDQIEARTTQCGSLRVVVEATVVTADTGSMTTTIAESLSATFAAEFGWSEALKAKSKTEITETLSSHTTQIWKNRRILAAVGFAR